VTVALSLVNLLLGDVDHLLHDVHLAADAIDERDHQIKAGLEDPGVAAEPLYGPMIPLRHRLDAEEYRQDRQKDDEHDDHVAAAEHHGHFPSQ
jgi:hypothetical protein